MLSYGYHKKYNNNKENKGDKAMKKLVMLLVVTLLVLTGCSEAGDAVNSKGKKESIELEQAFTDKEIKEGYLTTETYVDLELGDGFSYEDIDGGISLSFYLDSMDEKFEGNILEIPEEYDGKKVLAIAAINCETFYSVNSDTVITELRLPDSCLWVGFVDGMPDLEVIEMSPSIQYIGGLYTGKTNLKEIIIPDTVLGIGDFAFASTVAKEIVLPDNIKVIPYRSFRDSEVENIILPSNLVEIEDSAFEGAFNLKTIKIPEGTEILGTELVYNIGNVYNGIVDESFRVSVEIPESVTSMKIGLYDLNFGDYIVTEGSYAHEQLKIAETKGYGEGMWSYEVK